MPVTITKLDQPYLLATAADLTGGGHFMHDAIALGFYDDPDLTSLRAVIVFDCLRGQDADVHLAMAPGRRMTRHLAQQLVMVAMIHPAGLRRKRLWAQIRASNKQAIAAAVGAGFEFEYRRRGSALHGEDAIVLTMTAPPVPSGTLRPIKPPQDAGQREA